MTETQKIVHEHLVSVGFSPELATEFAMSRREVVEEAPRPDGNFVRIMTFRKKEA